jgi:hypothetical protein
VSRESKKAFIRRRDGHAVNAGRAVWRCLRDGSLVNVRRTSPAALAEAAKFHRTVGSVQACAARDGVRLEDLSRLHRAALARQVVVLQALRGVDRALRGAGVEFLVLKGPVLAEVVYDRGGRRFYEDLDILVRTTDFAPALEALEARGATVSDPGWPYARDELAGEVRLTSGVDLHWHFVYEDWARAQLSIAMNDVIDRARRTVVSGVDVLTLDPIDNLVYIALHACIEGGDRLMWLKDVEQAVLNDRPQWDAVVDRAFEWSANLHLGTMLLRSRRLLNTPVPDDVIHALIPSRAWRALLAAADRSFPIHEWTGRQTAATLLARATRKSPRATVAFILGAPARRLRRSHGWASEPHDSESAREAYLNRVRQAT